MSAAESPDAYAAPKMAPIEVPAIILGLMPSSSKTSSIRICARPLAPPPPRTRPMDGWRFATALVPSDVFEREVEPARVIAEIQKKPGPSSYTVDRCDEKPNTDQCVAPSLSHLFRA